MRSNAGAPLLLLISLFFGSIAHADPKGEAISDGTTLERIKSALQEELDVSNVEVTEYGKAWSAYNPMSWALDPYRKYRDIVISFTDKHGNKQTLSCQMNLVSGSADATIHSCTGGMMSIGAYSKLVKYGYNAPSLIVKNIVSSSTTSKGSEGGASSK